MPESQKPDRTFEVICELIDDLVHAHDTLSTLPNHARLKKGKRGTNYSFNIKTPEERADAIISILFGYDITPKPPGNPDFFKQDEVLINEYIIPDIRQGLGVDKSIQKYLSKALRRSEKTEDDSVFDRLKKRYHKILREKGINPTDVLRNENNLTALNDFFSDDATDDIASVKEDMMNQNFDFIRYWLKKYAVHLRRYMGTRHI
jgi:hypothetical protein